MSQNYYKLYINSVLDLAETLVIKSEESAQSINEYQSIIYGKTSVDPYNPSSWKYYLNICGEYHETDELIYVTSLDTLDKIIFNKENLSIHTATAAAYQYNTRHYRELVSNNKNSEQLILGILYPANMQEAIAAKDGKILSYPKYLVESNEYSFIEKLDRWIEVFKIRWSNPQFGLSDSLYSATMLGIMYHSLVPAILNIRLAACKTNEAHSYHVRTYLASHGMLDVYLDSMTKKQALFFYRNIAYIERNNGKREIFEWLVEHIMTERGLPVSEFTMKHNESTLPTTLYPGISFRKKAINNSYNNQEKNLFSLSDILDKEEPLALGNKEYRLESEVGIQKKFELSLSSVVGTKMLESSMIDYTDATPYTFEDIVMNHWVYLAANNLYPVYINFKVPATGEKYSLLAKDAYIYLMFVLARAIGSDITTIPKFLALRVQRLVPPTLNELMSVVDTKYVSTEDAQWVLDSKAKITRSLSIEAFYKQARTIYDSAQHQRGFISNQEHFVRRGMVHNLVNRLYTDSFIHFDSEGELFVDWMAERNLPSTVFTQNQYLEIFKDIYENSTGASLNTTESVRNIQKAMVALLEQLSSYSIQFISELNNSNIKNLNWAILRLGDIKGNSSTQDYLHTANISILDVNTSISRSLNVDVTYPLSAMHLHYIQETKYKLDVNIDIKLSGRDSIIYRRRMLIPTMTLKVYYEPETIESYFKSPLVAYIDYMKLPDDEKNKLKDIYCKCFEDYTGVKTDINEVLPYNEINCFEYTGINTNNEIKGFEYTGLGGYTTSFRNGRYSKDLNAFYTLNFNPDVGAFKSTNIITAVDGIGYINTSSTVNNFVTASEDAVMTIINGELVNLNLINGNVVI